MEVGWRAYFAGHVDEDWSSGVKEVVYHSRHRDAVRMSAFSTLSISFIVNRRKDSEMNSRAYKARPEVCR